MREVDDESIHLMVTSPPYYNAPFDYKGVFESYDDYLILIRDFAAETYRALVPGRIAVVNTDDMLVEGEKYPIVADTTTIFREAGFRYRDKIIWRKPEGYIRISRRSGVILQHPYPMYFYPDNIQESILIFQKGRYTYPKSKDGDSRLDLEEFQNNKWYLTVWDITNVLPSAKKGDGVFPAAFPDELPYRIIKLFSHRGEWVLDPFLGSGTTSKVSIELGRNSVGYELHSELRATIEQKLSVAQRSLFEDAEIQFVERQTDLADAKQPAWRTPETSTAYAE